jgi:hypothetical protein
MMMFIHGMYDLSFNKQMLNQLITGYKNILALN